VEKGNLTPEEDVMNRLQRELEDVKQALFYGEATE
jgi:hypothetical protein